MRNISNKKNKVFENLYRETISKGPNAIVDYKLISPKHRFLEYIVENKGVLLHGSYDDSITVLEPRQANCMSKKFGNLKAVYAVEDHILPIFYAIRDVKNKGFKHYISSGCTRIGNSKDKILKRKYHFELHPDDLKRKPWASGVVYILPKETFVQGENDQGQLIDEWASFVPVIPLARLSVTSKDFPYMKTIKAYIPTSD